MQIHVIRNRPRSWLDLFTSEYLVNYTTRVLSTQTYLISNPGTLDPEYLNLTHLEFDLERKLVETVNKHKMQHSEFVE